MEGNSKILTNEIIMQLDPINEIYLPYLKEKSRYFHLYGGAGSGKSVFAAQKLIARSMQERNHRILLVRKVARTIRMSQFSLIKALIHGAALTEYFDIKESDFNIRCKFTDSEFIASGMDDSEKLKSIYGITSIWIEEATELDYKDFLQLDLRLRGKTKNYKQIILTYNPINANHWLNTVSLKNSVKLKTTYKDNVHIDEEYKKILLDLNEQDKEFYNVYALGEWGILKNIIYKPFEKLNQYPDFFDEIIFGLDFGYNNNSALIEIGIKDKIYYLTELIYENRLTNSDLIKKMKEIKIPASKYIYCDSAEPGRIEELKRNGYNTIPAEKNIKDGIDFLKTCKIFSNSKNNGTNKEVLSYSYKQDKEGNILEEPVKFNDHAMDAIRYAIYSYHKKRGGVNPRLF